MELKFIHNALYANDVLIGTIWAINNEYKVDCFLPALGAWRYKLKYKCEERAKEKLLKLSMKWFDMVK